MAYKPKFHGSIPIDDNAINLTIQDTGEPTTQITIYRSGGSGSTEEYFIRAYTGESIASGRAGAQLCEEIQQRVRNIGSAYSTFTCTVSDDGLATMTNDSVFSVTWDDVALRNILGFRASLSGATSYTSPDQHMYGWYPDEPIMDRDGDEREEGMESADATIRRAPSGQVVGLVFAELMDRNFTFGFVPKDRARAVPTDGVTTANRVANRSFTEWWRQCAVRRWRWYPDATRQYRDLTDASGAPWEYRFDQETVKGGPSKALARSIELVDLYYTVQFSAHAYRP